ncbi:hypothetical protein D3C71_2058930 [compost metagenome]
MVKMSGKYWQAVDYRKSIVYVVKVTPHSIKGTHMIADATVAFNHTRFFKIFKSAEIRYWTGTRIMYKKNIAQRLYELAVLI